MKLIPRDVPPRSAWALEQAGVPPLLARLFAARGIRSADELDDAPARLLPPDATADAAQQLQRLVPKNFIAAAPWTQLQHYARYLKAITSRLDKYRADPARDASRLAELRPLEQRYSRLVAERKGAVDARMQEYRWMLEELRVQLFAQTLRTPVPVSAKRLQKLWESLQR